MEEISMLQISPLLAPMADALPFLTRVTDKDGVKVVAPISMRRDWWRNLGSTTYPLTAAAAMSSQSAHATSAAAESAWSAMGRQSGPLRNELAEDRREAH
jgi:hypothetical protein